MKFGQNLEIDRGFTGFNFLVSGSTLAGRHIRSLKLEHEKMKGEEA